MSDVACRPPWWRRSLLPFLSGVLSVILLLVIAYFGVRKFGTGGRLPERQPKTEAELAAGFSAGAQDEAAANRADIAWQVETLYARQQLDPNATLDFLLLSGGGDHAAFGAGFLSGWASVEGKNAMPKFDGVSGVSAGALIAPFAFLGTPEALEAINRLVRDPKPDWVVPRGLFFFLPENASFADVPGLMRDLCAEVDLNFAERIVRASTGGKRVLLIQATDADLGTGRTFDAVAAARQAVATGDPDILRNILLASAAVPGAFPPREIEGRLYMDGSITSNFYYGDPTDEGQSFGAVWRREHPDAPIPKTRYWLVINEYIRPAPVTLQPKWLAIVERSIYMSVRSSEMIALRHLYAIAEATKLRGGGEVEVRWVAVPQTWKTTKVGYFDKEKMRELSDEGRRLGADPQAWMTKAP